MDKSNKILLSIIIIFSIIVMILSICLVKSSMEFANTKQEVGSSYEKYKNSENLYINACKYLQDLENNNVEQ